jgi:phosphomevalonate kinase
VPAAGLVHAPGKLVILGEYAVLDGGPALATAVHRGVGCEVGPAGDVLVETPADDRFVRAALTALSAPPARYRFFDLDPAAVPGKPGFGGSAAATVAAVIAAGGRGEEAYRIHREVQGGGSGVDVAASLHGGTLRFEGGAVEALDPVRPAVVHAGHPSSTAPRVAAYRAWRGWREDFTRRSAEIVAVFDRDPIAALDEAATLLERMAGAAGIDYLTPALERIRALAREHGGAAKPSGAGGGDCAVALFACPESEVAFLARCAALGLPPIPVRVAAPAGWRVAPPAGEHRA